MKTVEEILNELEKLVEVPNNDKQPEKSVKGLQMFILITELRGLIGSKKKYHKSETKTTMLCGDCGQKLTKVRPGKYQCDNQKCKRNNQ